MALWMSSEMKEWIEDMVKNEIDLADYFPTEKNDSAGGSRTSDIRPKGHKEKPMYAKNTAPTRPTAPSASASAAKTMPVASLSIGIKNGAEGLDFHDLTGLFDATDKKGGKYFRVSVKEELYIPKGASIFLRPNESATTPEASISYGVGDKGGKMAFTDVLTLATAVDKSGKNYFKGTAAADIVIPAGSLFFARPKTGKRN